MKFLPLLAALASCAGPYHWRLTTSYPATPAVEVVPGVRVAANGTAVDLADARRRALAVAACLGVDPAAHPVTVAVAPDAVPSCVGPYLVLPVPAPGVGCTDKGQTPSAACPCRWRAGIQLDGAVVVPPDLWNLGDPLVRLWAAPPIDDPWTTGALNQRCALAGAGPPSK